MLPKVARLSAPEVRRIMRTGRSARAAGISAKYEPADKGQIAVVVSKRVAKSAVERNRLRRRAYRSLPTPLPKARVVLFVLSADFEPTEVAKLCSPLS